MMYNLWNAMRVSLFGIYYAAVFIYGYSLHIKSTNHSILLTICKALASINCHRRRLYNAKLLCKLHLYYKEYHFFRQKFSQLNVAIISPVLLVCLATNMPFNITMTSILCQWKMDAGEQTLLCGMIVSQYIYIFLICSVLAWAAELMKSSHQMLYKAQIVLKSNRLQAKLKLQAAYELIHGKRRFHFTLGPFTVVSRRAIYQVMDFYRRHSKIDICS